MNPRTLVILIVILCLLPMLQAKPKSKVAEKQVKIKTVPKQTPNNVKTTSEAKQKVANETIKNKK